MGCPNPTPVDGKRTAQCIVDWIKLGFSAPYCQTTLLAQGFGDGLSSDRPTIPAPRNPTSSGPITITSLLLSMRSLLPRPALNNSRNSESENGEINPQISPSFSQKLHNSSALSKSNKNRRKPPSPSSSKHQCSSKCDIAEGQDLGSR